jgi:hypothetical protein
VTHPGEQQRIDACVIFAGGLRASPLQAMSPVSVLDLMLTQRGTVLECILARIAENRDAHPLLPVSVVWGPPVPEPSKPVIPAGLEVRITREPSQWRGSAGLLLDLCAPFASDATILVIEGSRWLGASLGPLLADHARRDALVTVACTPDLCPAGVYTMRRSALDLVPRIGYLDLKEQLFSKLVGTRGRVHIHTLQPPGAMPLRTLDQFLAASFAAAGVSPGASIISPSARIASDATVVGSVIMDSAQVQSRAIVARSIILKGAAVNNDEEVVDALVGPVHQRLTGARISRSFLSGGAE